MTLTSEKYSRAVFLGEEITIFKWEVSTIYSNCQNLNFPINLENK
jgi:hypothetical protein